MSNQSRRGVFVGLALSTLALGAIAGCGSSATSGTGGAGSTGGTSGGGTGGTTSSTGGMIGSGGSTGGAVGSGGSTGGAIGSGGSTGGAIGSGGSTGGAIGSGGSAGGATGGGGQAGGPTGGAGRGGSAGGSTGGAGRGGSAGSSTGGAGGRAGSGGTAGAGGQVPGCALTPSTSFSISGNILSGKIQRAELTAPANFGADVLQLSPFTQLAKCTPPFPACRTQDAIDVSDVVAAAEHADVKQAFGQALSATFEQGPAPALTVRRLSDDHTIRELPAASCALPSCTPAPEGVKVFLALLKNLIAQQLADPSCDAVRQP